MSRKILIIPSLYVNTGLNEKISARRKMGIQPRLQVMLKKLRDKYYDNLFAGEVLYYCELSSLLGRDSVFILGGYSNLYFRSHPEEVSYPSLTRIPPAVPVTPEQAKSLLGQVDAVLVTPDGIRRNEGLIQDFARLDKPTAIIDFQDHEAMFVDPNAQVERDFKQGKHFTHYFKKDLPLRETRKNFFPLAPLPVRPECYNLRPGGWEGKSLDIFFRGRLGAGRVRKEREEAVRLLRTAYPNTDITWTDVEEGRGIFPRRMVGKEYWQEFERSRIALSPGGRVWDSFRHCEIGLFGCTLIIPLPDCQMAGIALRDGYNCIGYDVRVEDGEHRLVNSTGLVEKVRGYLKDDKALQRLALQWQRDVMQSHTSKARAQQILDGIFPG
jgi:Glycosyl transferases group 1